ncbi:unnamed protein product [Trichogramma brassicae]|uniref:Uncharacterized protein n=1 Tax=Trichogramma brassicae TaxID=86971 RepID=A0A6H5IEY9_9HYME|nr:unnamed protein product [Trichogramma brassicae]
METSDFMQQLRAFKPQSLGCAVARRKSSTTLIFPLPPQACSVLPRAANSNVDRSTPLHIICKEEFWDTYNFDPAEMDLQIDDELDDSERINNVRLAKMLLHINGKLNEPVRIDSQDRLGNAPLHLAILRSKRKLTELLLDSDADPNLANEEGLTPLHLVCRRHRDRYDDSADEFVSLIESFFRIVDQKEKTLKFDARDKKGRTALQLAVANLLPQATCKWPEIGSDSRRRCCRPASELEKIRFKTKRRLDDDEIICRVRMVRVVGGSRRSTMVRRRKGRDVIERSKDKKWSIVLRPREVTTRRSVQAIRVQGLSAHTQTERIFMSTLEGESRETRREAGRDTFERTFAKICGGLLRNDRRQSY